MVLKEVTQDVWGRPLPCVLRMDDYLHSNIEIIRDWIDEDWDVVGLFVGREGAGKSTLMQEVALSINANISVDDIFFLVEDFEEWVEHAKPGSVGIWDEADELADGWNSSVVKAIKRRMKRMRDKNLVLLLGTPTMRDLGWYFAKHRTLFAMYVHAYGPKKRGFYHLYNYEDKEALWDNLKRYGESSGTYKKTPKSIEDGYFPDIANLPGGREDWPIDWKEYKAKKAEATNSIRAEEDASSPKAREIALRRKALGRIIRHINERTGKDPSQRELAWMFDVSPATINSDLRAVEVFSQ